MFYLRIGNQDLPRDVTPYRAPRREIEAASTSVRLIGGQTAHVINIMSQLA
jgi:hypothetical protein